MYSCLRRPTSPTAGFVGLLVTASKDLGFRSVVPDFDKMTNESLPGAAKGGAIFPGDGFVSFTAQLTCVYIRE